MYYKQHNALVKPFEEAFFANKKMIWYIPQNQNHLLEERTVALLQNHTVRKACELIFVTNQLQDSSIIAQAIADVVQKSDTRYLNKKINNISSSIIVNLVDSNLEGNVNFYNLFCLKTT